MHTAKVFATFLSDLFLGNEEREHDKRVQTTSVADISASVSSIRNKLAFRVFFFLTSMNQTVGCGQQPSTHEIFVSFSFF